MNPSVETILESTREALQRRARIRCVVNAALAGLSLLFAGHGAGCIWDLGLWKTAPGLGAFLLVLGWGWPATRVTLSKAGLVLDHALTLKERAVTAATCTSSLLSPSVAKDLLSCTDGMDLKPAWGGLWPGRIRYLALPVAGLLTIQLLWTMPAAVDPARGAGRGASAAPAQLQPVPAEVATALRQRLAALLAIPEDERTAAEKAELASLQEALANALAPNDPGEDLAVGKGERAGRDGDSGSDNGALRVEMGVASKLIASAGGSDAEKGENAVPLVWKRYIALRGSIPVQYRKGVGSYFRVLMKEE